MDGRCMDLSRESGRMDQSQVAESVHKNCGNTEATTTQPEGKKETCVRDARAHCARAQVRDDTIKRMSETL